MFSFFRQDLSADLKPLSDLTAMRTLACFFTCCCLLMTACQSDTTPPAAASRTDALGVRLTAGQNREFSYTDKVSAYFYGRTHSKGTDYFSGWNIATKRIFQDYTLLVDGDVHDRAQGEAIVFPDRLERRSKDFTEVLRLYDEKQVIGLEVQARAGEMALILEADWKPVPTVEQDIAFYAFPGEEGHWVGVAPRQAATLRSDSLRVQTSAQAGGFWIVYAKGKEGVRALVEEARKEAPRWQQARRQRLEQLLATACDVRSGDAGLDSALAWTTLTLDQLVTRQTGEGIYAGLPWFNDYWGRDMFISLPGACLVTGQFDKARAVLASFARFQDTVAASPTFGRIPNRVRPDEVIYNTTDGTPRFVLSLHDYWAYTGDTAFVRSLYPVVQRAAEASIARWTDADGYLTHEDADTWMDAKINGKIPWSPRGNRANDIQALWYGQLLGSRDMALLAGQQADAARWAAVAAKLEKAFVRDFVDRDQALMADRLLANGQADKALRPNQLFALDFVRQDPLLKTRITRQVWEKLTYPWGVASLSQEDDQFHPYHEHWDYYHKDAAYHNGTVWLWNNGIAIQRMTEADQPDAAFELFAYMSRLAMRDGAVGSLSELTDALPRPGTDKPRLSGTFLQAWSNAEYLRVWYQCFAGIKPQLQAGVVSVRPCWPQVLTDVSLSAQVAAGRLRAVYRREGEKQVFEYQSDQQMTLLFALPDFAEQRIPLDAGEKLIVEATPTALELRKEGAKTAFAPTRLEPDPARSQLRKALHQAMNGVSFAKPILREGLKSLQKPAKTAGK